MLMNHIEGKWIADFVEVFGLCRVQPGEVAAILSESQSRPVLAELAELALAQMGARVFHVRLPTPRLRSAAPLRSTGASPSMASEVPVERSGAALRRRGVGRRT
jgi:2,5-dihydroxypyridine 5,6-dioxygenase